MKSNDFCNISYMSYKGHLQLSSGVVCLNGNIFSNINEAIAHHRHVKSKSRTNLLG